MRTLRLDGLRLSVLLAITHVDPSLGRVGPGRAAATSRCASCIARTLPLHQAPSHIICITSALFQQRDINHTQCVHIIYASVRARGRCIGSERKPRANTLPIIFYKQRSNQWALRVCARRNTAPSRRAPKSTAGRRHARGRRSCTHVTCSSPASQPASNNGSRTFSPVRMLIYQHF